MPIRRTVKNIINNYSDSQVKVREATSNDPWGPSSTLMCEIADLTYNVMAYTEIMQMIWKRLNDHGKNWRHVYKALVLLDYIIKTGSEKVAQQCKENRFAIETLKDFQYVEENKDQGVNVREKAKQLVALLKDDERLRNERAKALKAKERFAQNSSGMGSTRSGTTSPASLPSPTSETPREPLNQELESARPSTAGEEELQLQLALAMSKEEHDQEERQRRGDDVKLQMALENSKEKQPSLLELSQGSDAVLNTDGGLWDEASAVPSLPPPSSKMTSDPWKTVESIPAWPSETISDPWNTAVTSYSQPLSLGQTIGAASLGHPMPLGPHMAGANSLGQPMTGANSLGQPMAGIGQPLPTGPLNISSMPFTNPTAVPDVSSAMQASSNDPWSSNPWTSQSGANGSNSIVNPLDDAFDQLSSRGNISSGNGDTNPTVNTSYSASAFDLGCLSQGLPRQFDQSKSPASFLGENASLVNLDNLISKPAASQGALNPFGNSSPQPDVGNPFANQNQMRVPLNQMNAGIGFTQSGSMLPAPLLPVGSTGLAQSATNPFM